MNLFLQIKAGVLLIIGILLLVIITPTYLSTVGVVIALIALKTKKQGYGYQVWIAFDKFWNAVRGGDHRETISSGLGKSVHYNLSPVFGFRFIDRFVAFLLNQVDSDHCRKSIDWSVKND